MSNKKSYRDLVRIYLLNRMRNGSISTGDSISLAQLSRELNISTTPIREALTQLQYSKIVQAIPNKGFIIPKLSRIEAGHIYELVAELECIAIIKSKYTKTCIKKLKMQQSYFEKQTDALKRVNADIEFHNVLTSMYNNEIALDILNDLKTRIFFYELGFMNFSNFHKTSEDMHSEIINAIEKGNLLLASKITKENWLQILNYMNL